MSRWKDTPLDFSWAPLARRRADRRAARKLLNEQKRWDESAAKWRYAYAIAALAHSGRIVLNGDPAMESWVRELIGERP